MQKLEVNSDGKSSIHLAYITEKLKKVVWSMYSVFFFLKNVVTVKFKHKDFIFEIILVKLQINCLSNF